MLKSRPEQGVETDDGVTGEYALQVTTYMPVGICAFVCVFMKPFSHMHWSPDMY